VLKAGLLQTVNINDIENHFGRISTEKADGNRLTETQAKERSFPVNGRFARTRCSTRT
jgi:hypothetical protein